MRRLLVLSICIGVVFTFLPSANAAAKVFKSCTELNRVYPGGIALPSAVNAGGTTKKVPMYNKALYLANKKSDRDKDGIACEK